MFGSYYAGLPYGGQSDGLVFGVDLVVADALHTHTVDALNLTQDHVLAMADTLHAHTVDGNLVLVEAKTLVMNDALHVHTADNIDLIQQHLLAIADAIHNHTADAVTLVQQHVLAVADALQAHTAENAFVAISTVLIANDAHHGHTAENAVIFIKVKITPESIAIINPLPNAGVIIERPDSIPTPVKPNISADLGAGPETFVELERPNNVNVNP